MQSVIQLNQVSVRYPGRTTAALRDISMSLSAGESICIMGANGSGKSTLALVIAGVLKPTGGTIQKLDQTNHDSSNTGIVFQNPENQMVATLVEKELAFGLENQAISQAGMEAEIALTATAFGIQSLLRSSTTKLSGGEQQRVALASVMITSPQILILDEPDAFLDSPSRDMLTEALKEIHARLPELIEVRVSQDFEVARRASRLILLDRGKIVADSSPDTILADSDLLRICRLVVDSATEDSAGQVISESFGADAEAGQPDRLEVKNLAFAYAPDRPVIRGLSFSVARGEVLGVAGPTGSGKTTLGLILAGALEPTSGEIIWENKPTALSGGPFATIALQLPERQFFLPTCAQEIAFGPENNKRALRRDQIDALLELVGLPATDFRDRDPFTLSVGEQRRLACAVVLGLRRSFIVFDEPTAGLDADGASRFIGLVRQIKSWCGVMVISHDDRLLATVADRVLRLDKIER